MQDTTIGNYLGIRDTLRSTNASNEVWWDISTSQNYFLMLLVSRMPSAKVSVREAVFMFLQGPPFTMMIFFPARPFMIVFEIYIPASREQQMQFECTCILKKTGDTSPASAWSKCPDYKKTLNGGWGVGLSSEDSRNRAFENVSPVCFFECICTIAIFELRRHFELNRVMQSDTKLLSWL